MTAHFVEGERRWRYVADLLSPCSMQMPAVYVQCGVCETTRRGERLVRDPGTDRVWPYVGASRWYATADEADQAGRVEAAARLNERLAAAGLPPREGT